MQSEPVPLPNAWVQLEQIRAQAQTGRNFSQDHPHQRAAFEAILAACKQTLLALGGADLAHSSWTRMASELGVITPKSGAVAGLLRGDGRLLVLQRPSGKWCLPCGFADSGETAEEAARREVFEETGLLVTDLALLELSSSRPDVTMAFMWKAVFVGRAQGTIRLSPEHGFWAWIDNVEGRSWHSVHRRHALHVLQSVAKRGHWWLRS